MHSLLDAAPACTAPDHDLRDPAQAPEPAPAPPPGQSSGPPPARRPWFEVACAALIVAAVAWPLALTLHALATTSLWGDEIASVWNFSSRGPWHVVTDYVRPNNHIFFNLLNALTPGAGSCDPLRARLWSFVAFFLGLGFAAWFFARRQRFLEGAVFVALLALVPATPDLLLQARGYGLLHACALGCLLLATAYLERPRTWHLTALGVLVALGTWTVPNFIAFGEALLVLLAIQCRRRAVVTTAVATFLAIALLHCPVLKPMLGFSTTYAQFWGQAAADVGSWFRSLLRHVLPGSPWLAGAAALVAVAAPFLRVGPEPLRRALRLGAGAAAACLAACLLLRTPPARTVAFTTVVVGLSLAVLVGEAVRRVPARMPRRLAMGALTAALVAAAAVQAVTFRFVPIDDYSGVAAAIRQLAPPGTRLHLRGEAYLVRAYLPADTYPVVAALDADLFRAGRLWVVDAAIDVAAARRFKAADLAPEGGVDVEVPQRRSGFQRISFCRPR